MAEITYRDVEGFISDRCPDFRCPACGGTRLEPAAEGGGQPIALLYENSPAKSWFGPPGYLRVFALNCASCSYVIIFRLDALEHWVRTRPRQHAPASNSAAGWPIRIMPCPRAPNSWTRCDGACSASSWSLHSVRDDC
jgi:hypothetical protein